MNGRRFLSEGAMLAAACAMGLGVGAGPVSAHELGTCVVAEVPESYVLLDGAVHAPGKLTLCVLHLFTPVSNVHLCDAGSDGTTMALSRRALAAEYAGDRAQVLFERRADGRLHLVGYVVPSRSAPTRYAFVPRAPMAGGEEGAADLARVPGPPEEVRLLADVRH